MAPQKIEKKPVKVKDVRGKTRKLVSSYLVIVGGLPGQRAAQTQSSKQAGSCWERVLSI